MDPEQSRGAASSARATVRLEGAKAELSLRGDDRLRLILYILGSAWIVMLVTVLFFTRYITVPIFAAIVFGIILAPASEWMARYKIPEPMTVFVLLCAAILSIGSLAYFLFPSFNDLMESVPKITEKLQGSFSWFERFVSMFDNTVVQPAEPGVVVTHDKVTKVQMAGQVLGFLTPAISQIVIFVFTLLLFTSTRVSVRNWLTLLFRERDKRLSALRSFKQAETQLARYFFTVTVINAGLGTLTALIMWVLGAPSFAIWGVMVFVANFLPVVGPIVIKVSLLLFGLATYPNTAEGLLPAVAFTTMSLIEANFVTPRIVGSRITMNPLVIFLSVVFWTWLWGAPGAFLAMPMVAIVSVIKEEFFKPDEPALPS